MKRPFLAASPRLRSIAGFVAALLLTLLSLGWYFTVQDGYHFPEWQVYFHDHGDFRFLAEAFWGVPHDLASYGPEFSRNWGNFLGSIPFRGLGPGTFYLVVHGATLFFDRDAATDPLVQGFIVSSAMKGLVAVAYLTFFVACRRRFGFLPALLCLALLIFPAYRWAMTEELLAEPFLRALFVFMLAALVSINSRESLKRNAVVFMAIGILCAHFKTQWSLYPLIMAPVFFWAFHLERFRMKDKLPFLLLAVAAPASLLLVNGLVWGDPTLAPGSAFHANRKTHDHFIDSVCEAPDTSVIIFCGQTNNIDWFWHIYMGLDVSPEQYRALDARSLPFFMQDPMRMLSNFGNGIAAASNYPRGVWGDQPYGEPLRIRLLDGAVWLVLLLGLTRRESFVLAASGLCMWLIPAIAYMFALYVTRFHRPMAGIPLVIAIILLIQLVKSPAYARMKAFLAKRILPHARS